ncbi:serine--tRNA ligase [Caulobacter sp. 17J65-9]|uniref:serine--tRNA ligase n=1 Tax=Caulobacter sp. 17J65-9 TaxID=2709382 RepID=UPI0013C622AF|nr:serine--tRNA ligase [Caulobacter sp. 17J65-9]NEX94644.1 serine--tRNA ligase [Caulobacter sp. 17J65-9]
MHDIRALRETPDVYVRGWSSRGMADAEGVVAGLLDLDRKLRAAQTAFQEGQARRNEASKLIGQAKAKKDEAEAQRLMAEVESLKGAIATAQDDERALGEELREKLAALPNVPAEEVPAGEDETGNVEQRRWGDAAALPAGRSGAAKDHADLGEALGLMDFEAAARMSGARFVVLKGQLARLERAIGQFMLDLQTNEHGYTEVNPPLMVRDEAMYGTGQLPKFAEDLFHTTDGRWLIPTAEVSLTNLVREQITAEEELPLRLTALTNCFRAEAGSAGRDTKGMIRQHQFQKVELVSITTPEASNEEHERMTQCAEAVLKKLELPFRTVMLCTGDMGFTARKTYDLEVWLPSQGTYREISSCSNCGDFQARRMDARGRKAGEKGTRFLHTLNGSGLAVGRTLVAVLENYQDEGGRIAVPAALQPYMGGLTHVG